MCEVKVAQSCPTLCDPMGYTVHGILQVRISTPSHGSLVGIPDSSEPQGRWTSPRTDSVAGAQNPADRDDSAGGEGRVKREKAPAVDD